MEEPSVPARLGPRTGRSLLVTYPVPVTNTNLGAFYGVTASVDTATFTAWCDANATCAAAGDLYLTLAVTSNAVTTITNFPAIITADGANYIEMRLVSPVANLQIGNMTGLDQSSNLICGTGDNCKASLIFNVYGHNTSATFACLRLVTTAPGSELLNTYQVAGGHPDGYNNTEKLGILVRSQITCTTDSYGRYVVAQPPAPPPPPPSANPTGLETIAAGKSFIQFDVTAAIDYDALAGDPTFTNQFRANTAYWLAISLAQLSPALMTDQATELPAYDRVAVTKLARGSVICTYMVTMPKGAPEDKLNALVTAIERATAAELLMGSEYAGDFTGSVTLSDVSYDSDPGFWTTAHILIIAICIGIAALIVTAVVLFWLWRRRRLALLPPKPGSPEEAEILERQAWEKEQRRAGKHARKEQARAEKESARQRKEEAAQQKRAAGDVAVKPQIPGGSGGYDPYAQAQTQQQQLPGWRQQQQQQQAMQLQQAQQAQGAQQMQQMQASQQMQQMQVMQQQQQQMGYGTAQMGYGTQQMPTMMPQPQQYMTQGPPMGYPPSLPGATMTRM
ncbi:hypothetical protein FOA52_006309 [Chlamydomonas sp. UWO 241]|nr:hypothetical protein FOA52_006309 [Chlamydomonas sp. UWO 241]